MSLVRKDPSGVLTLLNLVAAAVCGAIGHPELAAALVAVAAAVLGLRTQVTPVAKANESAVQAAEAAARTVAENLGTTSAGAVGTVTDRGEQVIEDAVGLVAGLVGKH